MGDERDKVSENPYESPTMLNAPAWKIWRMPSAIEIVVIVIVIGILVSLLFSPAQMASSNPETDFNSSLAE